MVRWPILYYLQPTGWRVLLDPVHEDLRHLLHSSLYIFSLLDPKSSVDFQLASSTLREERNIGHDILHECTLYATRDPNKKVH